MENKNIYPFYLAVILFVVCCNFIYGQKKNYDPFLENHYNPVTNKLMYSGYKMDVYSNQTKIKVKKNNGYKVKKGKIIVYHAWLALGQNRTKVYYNYLIIEEYIKDELITQKIYESPSSKNRSEDYFKFFENLKTTDKSYLFDIKTTGYLDTRKIIRHNVSFNNGVLRYYFDLPRLSLTKLNKQKTTNKTKQFWSFIAKRTIYKINQKSNDAKNSFYSDFIKKNNISKKFLKDLNNLRSFSKKDNVIFQNEDLVIKVYDNTELQNKQTYNFQVISFLLQKINIEDFIQYANKDYSLILKVESKKNISNTFCENEFQNFINEKLREYMPITNSLSIIHVDFYLQKKDKKIIHKTGLYEREKGVFNFYENPIYKAYYEN